jgi:hypothetical protein
MALTAIVNLAERLLNNSSSQSSDTNVVAKPASPAASAVSDPNAGDQFTPSQAAEADAGLFQVSQSSLFTAAAALLLSQTNPPAANPGTPPPQTTNVAVQNAPQPSALPAASSPAAAPNNTTTTSTISVADQLQSLNASLAALGLDPSELAQVDRIASLLQDYNPAAFTSLVYQLEGVARAQAPQPANGNAAQAAANAAPIKKSANA